MYFALLNGGEILVIIIVVLVLFGGTRLPQLGDALGKGIRNFRKAVKKDEENADSDDEQSSEKKKEPLALPPASRSSQDLQKHLEKSNTST